MQMRVRIRRNNTGIILIIKLDLGKDKLNFRFIESYFSFVRIQDDYEIIKKLGRGKYS